ncbi:MAG TPA: hypothetical protein VMZ05_02080 [Spirochaetota bacterium]|nr:hypothetical protein [Spirochaetota bacterium]
MQGRVTIKPFGDFDFDPAEVSSVRNDIFRDGHFSVFDVLVHLSEREIIDLEYHFDDRMNTHVIGSINGETNYWYTAYYDGGGRRTTCFVWTTPRTRTGCTSGFHSMKGMR